jgi:transcriptional regulator with XRE-family HTH domain
MTITELRESLGLNGVEFARLISASPGQLHDWESGRQTLTVEKADQIERLTGMSGLVDEVVRERIEKARASGSQADAA